MRVTLTVNGQLFQLDVEGNSLLLDVLRGDLGLTGAKRSCDMEVCGACTVLVDGAPVSSCTYLAWQADGRQISTVEGLADGEDLHPLQEAFVRGGAVQCGFCIPGMLMTAVALLEREPHPDREEVASALSGNICRCTGYVQIVDAVHDAACKPAVARADAGGDER